jgi:ATP-binding cassette subfamily F protein 3
LRGFPGTLIFVSHDRYFVDALASRVVEVAGGRVDSYLGNYEDFLAAKARSGDNSHSTLRVEQCRGTLPLAEAQAESGPEPASFQERKEIKRLERRRQKDLAEVEEGIEDCESRLTALEKLMADPELTQDHVRWREVSASHAALQKEIEGLYKRWETLQTEPA